MTTRIVVPVHFGESGHDELDPETPCWQPEIMAATLRRDPGAGAEVLAASRPLKSALGTTVLVERQPGVFRLVRVDSWLRLVIEPGTPLAEAVAAVRAMPAEVHQVDVGKVLYSCSRGDIEKMVWRLENGGIVE